MRPSAIFNLAAILAFGPQVFAQPLNLGNDAQIVDSSKDKLDSLQARTSIPGMVKKVGTFAEKEQTGRPMLLLQGGWWV